MWDNSITTLPLPWHNLLAACPTNIFQDALSQMAGTFLAALSEEDNLSDIFFVLLILPPVGEGKKAWVIQVNELRSSCGMIYIEKSPQLM